jgi:hypothetical protein
MAVSFLGKVLLVIFEVDFRDGFPWVGCDSKCAGIAVA